MTKPVEDIERLGREVRKEFAPDPRTDVFDFRLDNGDAGELPRVRVETTLPEAGLAFSRRLDEADIQVDLALTVLPDPTLEPRGEALVRAAVAPAYRRPTMNSTLLTQYPLGSRITLLNGRGRFWRIRGEDGHVAWIHRGYLERGEIEWALAWERGERGDPMVSLGAVLVDDGEREFARLPWGARVSQQAGGRIVLPDGRAGRVGSGELVPTDRLWDRFPPRGESVIRTARRWVGVPYLWGGVTPLGVDCSGLVQSVYWLHGVALPRDSDMQFRVGDPVEPGQAWEALRPGDLVFFAEKGRINHVSLSLGGPQIVHASASNGGVELNDLSGDRDLERHLRSIFAGARRLLPD